MAPRAYLTALWWYIRRKRVRARGQFAPLLSHSRRAYDLWRLRERAVERGLEDEPRPPIIALIDIRAGQDGLGETLRSLDAEGISALQLGALDVPTLADVARQIDWGRDPWLMLIAVGDRCAPGTAAAYCAAIAKAGSGVRIAYADDDLLNKAGRRISPHFKPDWNSELFRYFDYISSACVLRVAPELLESVAEADDWRRQIVARVAEQGTPLHVRRVLHHRRTRPSPVLPAALDVPVRELPPVTVIVPTRNRVDLLQTCLAGIEGTNYPDIEVVVVDNDSDDPHTLALLSSLDPARYRVLRHDGAFNYSAINNRAVAEARGRLLCLLNNDIEMIEPNWLATMAVQAVREDVGAVGARLLYPDGRIQHAGVVIGVGNAAGHAHRLLRPDEEGYFKRHALPQFTSAVTAACLVVMRERFLKVGGLDEFNFAVAFNDVDLCMRLNRQGWQSLYEPRATLIHHESVSRGFDRDPVGAARFAGEMAALRRLWRTDELVDPFHHPELSRMSERFVVAL
ncbi:glycosyltransferase [Sphingomonas sp. MMSM20]|uniref:glycosyltransferase family 2 protein n=1 Tax=Sphingomonas lycopersici TaxID=2951807 RepID=UPI0022385EB9|nr:glycosyltransferase [Sphingomonas lycopersici]MCW6531248.1 glycosyltransferase [Sphingomonas lycopersici]